MKTRSKLLSAFLVVSALSAAVFACTPTPSPVDASAPVAVSGPKKGVNVNYTPEIGQLVAELEVRWSHPADGLDAGNIVSETVLTTIGPGPANIALAGASYEPSAALTASNTNFATLWIYKRTAYAPDASTVQTLLGPFSTAIGQNDAGADAAATGNWTAWIAVPFTMVPGAFVAPGDTITVVQAKAGTGVALPQGKISLFTSLN